MITTKLDTLFERSKIPLTAKHYLSGCLACMRQSEIMSAVPQAAFAVYKINKKEGKRGGGCFGNYDEATVPNPTKYNGKYMNSIWGMYNRYSVHNLKKIMEKDGDIFSGSYQNKNGLGTPTCSAAEKNSTVRNNNGIATGMVVSVEKLQYLPM